jgi:hypothetical protein
MKNKTAILVIKILPQKISTERRPSKFELEPLVFFLGRSNDDGCDGVFVVGLIQSTRKLGRNADRSMTISFNILF